MAAAAFSWVGGLALAVALFGAAGAQQIGPPIPPDQILRQQNQPIPPIPSPPVPATPPPGPPMPAQVPSARNDAYSDRVARCQHRAAEERVPRRRRGGYINNCIRN